MSDQGFDFGPPPPKREARQFEPPPWEREQFERHRREQAEKEAAEQEARAHVIAEQEAAGAVANAETEPQPGPATANAPGMVAEGGAGTVDQATPPHKGEVDEKQVAMMMLGLRAEEPETLEGAWIVNLAAGAVVAMIGLASVIWGAAALTRKGLPAAGTLGGVILLGFGLGFLGIGGWLVFKALRQRGVL